MRVQMDDVCIATPHHIAPLRIAAGTYASRRCRTPRHGQAVQLVVTQRITQRRVARWRATIDCGVPHRLCTWHNDTRHGAAQAGESATHGGVQNQCAATDFGVWQSGGREDNAARRAAFVTRHIMCGDIATTLRLRARPHARRWAHLSTRAHTPRRDASIIKSIAKPAPTPLSPTTH